MRCRVPVGLITVVVAACEGAPSEAATAWSPSSSDAGESDDPTGSSQPGDGTASSGAMSAEGEGPEDTGVPGDSSTDDGESSGGYDCTPWTTQWIGGPCVDDGQCDYDGGVCLREDQGFPCGTCSQPCDGLCPDIEAAPETFCVDGGDLDIDASGFCISQCDPGLLGGNGCRDGYTCAALERFEDPGVTTGVCVPDGAAEPMSACQQELVDRAVAFVPTTHELDHPDGHPELDCVIIDPVLLYGPIDGVGLVDGNGDDNPVLVACETAIAIADTAAIAASRDPAAIEIMHYGTYNCRVIAGTSSLSNHAEGRAIDLAAFTFAGGEQWSVYGEWEDGVANPVTPAGQWLRSFADELWDTETWHIILTPEYNADHNDHFHVDLTPGDMFYE